MRNKNTHFEIVIWNAMTEDIDRITIEFPSYMTFEEVEECAIAIAKNNYNHKDNIFYAIEEMRNKENIDDYDYCNYINCWITNIMSVYDDVNEICFTKI